MQADFGDLLLRFEVILKDHSSVSGHPIGPPTTFFGQGLDEALLFKSLDGPIERARLKLHTRKPLNILHKCVTVLGSVREARQNQRCWTGVMSEFAERRFHAKRRYYVNRYNGKCMKSRIAPEVQTPLLELIRNSAAAVLVY